MVKLTAHCRPNDSRLCQPAHGAGRFILSLMAASKQKSSRVVIAIGVFKLIKGLLLIAAGAGALSLLHKDLSATVNHWISILRVDPDNEVIHRVIQRLFRVTPKQLKEISFGTFCYAALFLTEGTGLLLRKRWAEYFTVITTAALIPVEIYELAKHFTSIKIAVLAINVAIVVYLVWRIRTAAAPQATATKRTSV